MLSRVGYIAVSGNFASGVQSNVSLAFMPIKRFSALAEASFTPGDDVAKDDLEFFSGNAGLGYNAPIGFLGRMDVYLGGGLGSSERRGNNSLLFSDPSKIERTRFTNAFFQFDIGHVTSYLESIYQLRANYVMFDRFETIRADRGTSGSLLDLSTSSGPRNELFLEHSYVLRFGPPNVKLVSFINISHRLTGKDEETLHVPVNLGVGLHLRLNPIAEDEPELEDE